jgi:hypothetical protein
MRVVRVEQATKLQIGSSYVPFVGEVNGIHSSVLVIVAA